MLPLVTAITLQGKAGGCLQASRACPAPGSTGVSWGLGALESLGAVHGGCRGTRISPKPCWVSLGVPQAELLLTEAVTGEVREVEIWKCLSCKNMFTNV